MQKCHGVKVLKSQCVFSYHCGIILDINMKRYLKVILISSNAMWHLPREILDLAIESLIKVKRLKNHRGWLQREREREKKKLNEKLISNIV